MPKIPEVVTLQGNCGEGGKTNLPEKAKDSGVYWVFINHHRKRKAKRFGDVKTARAAAEKINANLVLGEFKSEKQEDNTTFRQVADLWIQFPHDWNTSTQRSHRHELKNHFC